MPDKVQVGEIDATQNFDTFRAFGLQYTPTMILFKDGQPQWQYVGAMGKEDLRRKLESSTN